GRARSRRAGRGGGGAGAEPQVALRAGGALPAAPCGRELHPTPGVAGADRGRGAERAPLLQRRRPRPEHAGRAVPDQHGGRRVPHRPSRVLRGGRRRARYAARRLRHARTLTRTMRRAPVALAVVLALVASAAARELVIERFDATVVVPPDGRLAVTETIRPR